MLLSILRCLDKNECVSHLQQWLKLLLVIFRKIIPALILCFFFLTTNPLIIYYPSVAVCEMNSMASLSNCKLTPSKAMAGAKTARSSSRSFQFRARTYTYTFILSYSVFTYYHHFLLNKIPCIHSIRLVFTAKCCWQNGPTSLWLMLHTAASYY